MSKNNNRSRLNETDFSAFNLRDAYIEAQPEYIAALRDEMIFSVYGIRVLVKIPVDSFGDLDENNVDEYSNFVNTEWEETTESVVPLFKEYRENLSEHAGLTADGTDGIYPLEIILPSKLHIPRNSRIILSEYNSKQEKLAREWVVLGTVSKQLSNSTTYTRIANCVPARKNLFVTSEMCEGTLWFDWDISDIITSKNLRAQGTLWFDRFGVSQDVVYKLLPDQIFEQIPTNPIIKEQIQPTHYYDSRAIHIINAGSGFGVGGIYPVLFDGQPVKIYNENNDLIDLEIVVKDVDPNTGALRAFSYNVERGFTDINEGKGKQVTVLDATLDLVSVALVQNKIQETIDISEYENPKIIAPYEVNMAFVSKTLSISVLI